MLRGIRRLFTSIALLWLAVAGLVWPSSPGHKDSELGTICIESGIIYGFGWLLTYWAGGFKSNKRPIIDVTPRSPKSKDR